MGSARAVAACLVMRAPRRPRSCTGRCCGDSSGHPRHRAQHRTSCDRGRRSRRALPAVAPLSGHDRPRHRLTPPDGAGRPARTTPRRGGDPQRAHRRAGPDPTGAGASRRPRGNRRGPRTIARRPHRSSACLEPRVGCADRDACAPCRRQRGAGDRPGRSTSPTGRHETAVGREPRIREGRHGPARHRAAHHRSRHRRLSDRRPEDCR